MLKIEPTPSRNPITAGSHAGRSISSDISIAGASNDQCHNDHYP